MIQYTLRAEGLNDVIVAMKRFGPDITHEKIVFMGGVDCEFHFRSYLQLSEIIDTISEIPDGHIMLQTVNYAYKYSGELIFHRN